MPTGSRSDFSRQQLESINSHIDEIIAEVSKGIENGKN